MKKIVSITTGCAAAMLAFASCTDVLDIYPPDKVSPAIVWATEASAELYATGFYAIFRDNAENYNYAGNPSLSDAYSDILKNISWDQYGPHNKVLTVADLFSSNDALTGGFECWTGDNGHYNRIRRQNEFLVDARKYGAKYGDTWLDIRMAEVRFCRAYSYYLLCRVYGGVILRTQLDGPDQNDKARSTEQECWDFIVSELQAIAPVLPREWDAANVGRATQKSAYALLSRVALYAKKWDVAAQAARDTRSAGASLLPNYADVFTAGVGNREICFGVDFIAPDLGTRYDYYMRPPGDKLDQKPLSAFVPTSELADEYEMADGTPFSWATHGNNPYTGREPRFYATILHNGASWNGRTLETFEGAEPDGIKPFAETGVPSGSVTGYYLKKYLRSGDMSYIENGGTTHYWITIRYAEVLLNKAEALAELDWGANKTEALAALNEVRRRTNVNLPGRDAATKEEFMAFVRHERVVELAGEGLRYWDLRRWRLANGDNGYIDGKQAHGVRITRSGTAPNFTYTYTQVNVDAGRTRIFQDRYYAFAIPLAERSNNALCRNDNNPGW